MKAGKNKFHDLGHGSSICLVWSYINQGYVVFREDSGSQGNVRVHNNHEDALYDFGSRVDFAGQVAAARAGVEA